MSLDLYQRETAEKMAGLAPVQEPEAGAWDGFARGVGLYSMQSLAKTGRAIDLAGSVVPMTIDAVTGGTEAQDKYFREHDEVWGSAVQHWTPEPNEVGVAGQTVGQLVGLLPQVLASPGLAVAGTQLGTAEDLVNQGVDAGKANLAGAAQGVGLGVGIWMPVLGQNLWQRVLIGGAAFNAVQGAATRAVTGKILEGTPEAGQFKAFDGQALTLDVLLGAAFGSLVHLSPEARAQGAAAWDTLRDWAKDFKPSDVDAIAALRQAQHMNVDSTPGKPVAPDDVEAHVERLKTALEQMERGQPVNVTDKPAGQFEPDPVREADHFSHLEEMVDNAEQVRAQEGIVEPTAPDHLRTTPEMDRTFQDLQNLPREEQAQGVGDVIEAQLRRIGVEPAEAQANAAIWQAFAQTSADRYGITPAEILTRYGVGVSRGTPMEGGLEQPANNRTVEISGNRRPIADSTGKQIAPTTEGVRTFYRWFGDSKVVDAEGKPLVVYHGTERSFDEFSQTGAGKVRAGQEGVAANMWGEEDGFFFSESPEQASKFATGYRGTTAEAAPNVVPAYLTLKNPLTVDFGKDSGHYGANGKISLDDFRKQMAGALKAGHDGAIIHNLDDFGGRHTQYVAFKPEQIKSAIGNRGTFDATNPNILYQSTPAISEQPFYSELARQVDTAQMKQGEPKAWKDWIKSLGSKGVKADEIKWSGLEEWLDLHQGKVTKEAVQEFLRNNGVKVEEVMLGAGRQGGFDAIQREFESRGYRVERDPIGEEQGVFYEDPDGMDVEFNDLPPDLQRIVNENANEFGDEPDGATKFGAYQLPGGKNYRELLLTLPEVPGKTDTAKMDRVAQLRQEWQALSDRRNALPAEGALEEGRELGRQMNNNVTQQALAEKAATEGQPRFQSSHFDEPNILAHVRFNERTDADGKRVLFVEEFQSDWAQQGRKKGFADHTNEAALIKTHDTAMEQTQETAIYLDQLLEPYESYATTASILRGKLLDEMDITGNAKEATATVLGETHAEIEQALIDHDTALTAENRAEAALVGKQKGVPAAPFVGKTEAWVALTLKRMIRYAAENGFDKIAWTKGEQQVERYTQALRKAVDSIEWEKTKDGVHITGYKGKNMGRLTPAEESRLYELTGIEEGNNRGDRQITGHERDELTRLRGKVSGTKVVDTTEKEDVLSDAIGKSMAERIRNDPAQSGTIEGEAINVSDTGMASFYDRIVPNVAKDVLKKLGGGKVGEANINYGPKFEVVETRTGQRPVFDVVLRGSRNDEPYFSGATREQADEWAASHADMAGKGTVAQPSVEITPAMREKAMAGQPLFQGGRGQIHFGDQQTLIHLFENADRSTFVHETGHFFLNATRDLATSPNAPAGAVRDWAVIANWLDLDSDTIPRQAHEQFARGFEAYLMEGKAPTPMLRTVFQQFRDWLLHIYQSIADLKVDLTDDIRAVMDRMLTSQSQEPAPGATRSAPPEQATGDGSPPPSGEGGEAPAAAGPFVSLTSDQPEMHALLDTMAKHEAGWEQEGGKHLGGPAGTPNFSTWIPKSDWWAGRPDKLNADKVQEAVRKAIAGEPLKKAEQRTVDYMTEVANKRLEQTKAITDVVKPALEEAMGSADNTAGEAPDALAMEAERYVVEHPDQLVTIGSNPDGSPAQMTAKQYLEEVRAGASQARDDSKLFEVAATCLMGRS